MIEFEEGTSTPENWFRQAIQMLEASKVLYKAMLKISSPRSELDTHGQTGMMKGAMLLMGLAVENALKGAICYIDPPDVSSGKLKHKHFQDGGQSHDLLEIAKKSGIPLPRERELVLERLTIFIQWASKYQSPLRKADHEKARGSLWFNPSSDYKIVETLIDDLQHMAGYDDDTGWPLLR